MTLFTPTTTQRFLREGEDLFNQEYPTIVDRLALNILSGTNQYELPDYVLSIRRVTWLGWKIDATTHRDLRESNQTGNETGSRPFNYIFNNIGQLKIQFFPTPDIDISSVNNDLYGAEIPNRVIVEFYRASDYNTFTIPSFFSTRLLNAYAQSRLRLLEGRGTHLKSTKYFTQKWLALKDKYGELLGSLQTAPRRITIGVNSINPTVLTPQLSISKFGIGVDEGQ